MEKTLYGLHDGKENNATYLWSIFQMYVSPRQTSRLAVKSAQCHFGWIRRCGTAFASENTAISIDSLLIMDIVVRLSNGSLANVEIQKIPYMFTAERISCYSSDLLLREYTRLKENKKFMYSDMKKVYTIILYEKQVLILKIRYCMVLISITVKHDLTPNSRWNSCRNIFWLHLMYSVKTDILMIRI